MVNDSPKKQHFGDKLWDLWCLISIIGIWPRFIEPNMLLTTKLTLEVPGLTDDLEGFSLLQFSDLHINPKTGSRFLKRLSDKIKALAPDMIVYSGDFLCFSELPDRTKLEQFFMQLSKAPYGNFAILGNHDYSDFVALNSDGDYDIQTRSIRDKSLIRRGFNRWFNKKTINGKTTERAKKVTPHADLLDILKKTAFKLLHNETVQIKKGDGTLNISGFGEYMAGKMDLEKTYESYNSQAPGVLLLHNPDGIPSLAEKPGEIVLSGHTHGGQINLPFLPLGITIIENPALIKGLVRYDGRWVYVNRGAGATLPFRWFAPPEVLMLTLTRGGCHES